MRLRPLIALLALLLPLVLLLLPCGCSRHPAPPIAPPAAPPLLSHPAWAWLAGSPFANSRGNYGLPGLSTPGAVPPARSDGVAWADASGNFWIFGGISAPTRTSDTWYNDLWEFTGRRWIWVSGAGTPNQAGSYGTRGLPGPDNIPGARSSSVGWVGPSGNLWLFGGLGLDSDGVNNAMNDLWRFSAGQWTWMGGSRFGTQTEPGVYGSLGLPAPSNQPGARWSAASWTDAAGNFWLFGGDGVDAQGRTGYLSDLWRYSHGHGTGDHGTGGQWTWISGSNRANQPAVYGVRNVPDSANTPGARVNATTWVDAAGNFWLFGGNTLPGNAFSPLADLWKYARGRWTWVAGSSQLHHPGVYGVLGRPAPANQPGARVHAVEWTDAAGNFWLFGGDGIDARGRAGVLSDLWRYSRGQWTWMAGPDRSVQPAAYGILDILSPDYLPGARTNAFAAAAAGRFLLFGGLGEDSTGTLGYLNDLWSLQPPQ